MSNIIHILKKKFRKHLWDEAGQLAVAIGNEYCGYYGYNANGERVYKLTGTVLADQYDAGEVNIETYFDDIVLYVNPYMVVTPRGYTKYYYNGSERIAARLGDYWYNTSTMGGGYEKVDLAREVLEDRLNSGNTDEEYFEDEYYYSEEVGDIWCEPYTLRTTYSSCSYVEDMLYSVFDGGTCMSDEMRGIDKGIFYYHSDHLGSASWITDDQGGAVQYIHYMPFGELWVNQQANSYDERFKFTGKERDWETGYYYHGARYLSSLHGHWLSPDQLLDKYPYISPYAYCSWNPMRYVDPNGKEWEDETARNTAYKFREEMLQLKNDNQQQINAIDREMGNTEISANRKTELEGFRRDLLIAQKRLSDGISAISALEEDSNHKYGFTNTPSLGEASTVFMSDNGTIKIDAPSSALGMHEVLHVYQGLLQENLVFKEGYLVNAGKTQIQMLKNERDSYQLQYSIDKLSLPSYFQQPSIRGITLPLIDAFVDKNGNRPYHYK